LLLFRRDTKTINRKQNLIFLPHNISHKQEQNLTNLFVHRRLYIIDTLNESGHQPMCTPDARITATEKFIIAANCRVRWKNSDTRRIPYAERYWSFAEPYLHWGNECLEKLNGMLLYFVGQRKKKYSAPATVVALNLYYYFKNGVFVLLRIKSITRRSLLLRLHWMKEPWIIICCTMRWNMNLRFWKCFLN